MSINKINVLFLIDKTKLNKQNKRPIKYRKAFVKKYLQQVYSI